jgi:endonuclease/exonuclease/phosphatase family metal-dependent hydrolase
MKIVSLNLWNGGRLFDEAVQFLQAEAADLYFIQEAYNGHDGALESRFRTVDAFAKLFPSHHLYFAPVYMDTRSKEGNIEDGQLLMSRWPLVDQKNVFVDVPYGEYDQDATTDFTQYPVTLQEATISVGGEDIKLINVHGPVNFDGTADTERRLKMKELILAHATQRTIVAGDFNIQPQTQTIRDLAAQLTDVFADYPRTTSFNVKRKNLDLYPGYAQAVVDMMFVSPNWTVKTAVMPEVDVSDHLPLVVELEQ